MDAKAHGAFAISSGYSPNVLDIVQYGSEQISIIKTLLHLLRNHNLPTWVAFADLVKAFDTSNHQLMVMILARYGCPPNLCDTITRMYKDSIVKLVIDEFETTIDFKVGVKKGDSVTPVLFLFIVMVFA